MAIDGERTILRDMQPTTGKRRLTVGTRVRFKHDGCVSIGHVMGVQTDHLTLELFGDPVDMCHHSVTVRCDNEIYDVGLHDVILDDVAALFEGLDEGDVVIYGQRKQMSAIVLSSRVRRRMKRGSLVDRVVIVLVAGTKRYLPPNANITFVQRLSDSD